MSERITLLLGDCLAEMAKLGAGSVDSVVTDPPYHLTSGKKGGAGQASLNLASPAGRARITTGFMGKEWDGGDIAFRPEVWRETLRVLKPGGHLLSFGGTRTYHRMACAIEDAGFEIRDQIGWVYGSGFPKSHNIGDGWGTALKPAWEPIVMARKALIGTVAENVLAYGTGALNIGGCRVPVSGTDMRDVGRQITRSVRGEDDGWGMNAGEAQTGVTVVKPEGRWPANLIHDGSDEVLATFPEAVGQCAPVRPDSGRGQKTNGILGKFATNSDHNPRGDTGSAARFFYCAKASSSDRNDGLQHLDPKKWEQFQTANGTSGKPSSLSAGRDTRHQNTHPTVKPTALMRYLCRLVTPTGGVVLDPFMGSGSTGRGARLEGFRFVGIEREAEYLEFARSRIAAAERSAIETAVQVTLFDAESLAAKPRITA